MMTVIMPVLMSITMARIVTVMALRMYVAGDEVHGLIVRDYE